MQTSTTSNRDWSAVFATVLLIILTVWWLALSTIQTGGDELLYAKGVWGASYQILALWGGFWGLHVARSWGGLKSVMGRAIGAFSIGLLFQNLGQSVFSYYNLFAQVELPYPSIADIGYFGSIPLYIYGSIMLAKASGVSLSMKSIGSRLQAVIIPLIMLGISYYFFLRYLEVDLTSPLRVFLDFGYPLGQAIYISLALLTYLLSTKTLGGVMKNKVLFILLALGVQYCADYNFLYQAGAGTWGVSEYGDMIYLIAYYLMAIGLIGLEPSAITTPAKK